MKKILCIIIVLTLSMGLFSACGQDTKDSDSPSGIIDDQTTSEDAKEPTNEDICDEDPDDMNERITLNVVVRKHPLVKDLQTNAFTLWVEEKINVDLNITPVSHSEWNDKMGIMMATDDFPEISIGMYFPNVTLFGMEENILIPLDDLIDKYAPNIKKAEEEVPGFFDSMRQADGKIYSISTICESFNGYYGSKMWYYKPFLDTLGLNEPTTIDEFYNVLQAIKKGDPNGNGRADEIPLIGDSVSHNTFLFIANSFLYTQDQTTGFYLDDGIIKSASIQPEMREAIKFINKLFVEGLLYNNTFTQNMDQIKAIVEGTDIPVVGFVENLSPHFVSTPGSDINRNLEPISPLKGPDGVQYAWTYYKPFNQDAFVITQKLPEEKRIRAIKLADFLFTEEATMRGRWGRIGIEWDWAKDGEIGIDGEQAFFKSHTGWAPQKFGDENACWINFVLFNEPTRLRNEAVDPNIDIRSIEGHNMLLHQVTKEKYEQYGAIDKFLSSPKFTVEELDKVAQIQLDLDRYLNETLIRFITGELDINNDNAWNDHLDEINRLGIEELIELNQLAYDRFR